MRLTKRLLMSAAARWPARRIVTWKAHLRGRPDVAITFDDGPNPQFTPAILDVLASAGLPATFFVLGRQVEHYPALLRSIVEAGHEVGIHGYDHSTIDMISQVAKTRAIIQRLGSTPRTFRPPHGRLSPHTLAWTALNRMSVCLWSFDVNDSRRYEGKVAQRRPFEEIATGDIILLHDDNPICLAELPELLDHLRSRGLRPVRISTLLSF